MQQHQQIWVVGLSQGDTTINLTVHSVAARDSVQFLLSERSDNRKGWMFSTSPEGAHASAAMFTLVETAKANGIEPYVYLQYIIERIATANTDEAIDALMPWNMK